MDERKLNRIKGAVAAAPCLFLAATFLRTWADPMSVSEGKWLSYAVGIMILEFVLAHSGLMLGVYMSVGEKRSRAISVLLTLFYCLFAAIIALLFKSWGLAIIFMWVMGTRWASFILDPGNAKKEAVLRSTISLLLFMFAVITTLFVPLPELGVTQGLVDKIYPDRGTGEWADRPHAALATGVIYFSLLGLAELFIRMNAGKKAEA